MPRIQLESLIHAPVALCFDLARDIDFHMRSTAGTGEIAVSGVTSGLMGLGDEVTWEATHLGVRQRLTSRITQFNQPAHFRDSQVSGAFAAFDHDHFFSVSNAGNTHAVEQFDYRSPLGVLGHVADALFLHRYMRRFLAIRHGLLKLEAETRAARSSSSIA